MSDPHAQAIANLLHAVLTGMAGSDVGTMKRRSVLGMFEGMNESLPEGELKETLASAVRMQRGLFDEVDRMR